MKERVNNIAEKGNNDSLGRSFLSVSSSKFLKYGFQLISTMLLSRFRTLEEYGTFSQILLVSNLATSIIMMGLPNSLNYFLPRMDTKKEKNDFLSLYYSINSILSIIVGVLLCILTPLLIKFFDNPLLDSFVYFIALYPWTKIITSSVENLLVVYKRTRFLIVYRVSNSLFTILAVLVIQWLNLTFSEYVAAFLGIEVVFTIVTYLIASKNAGRLYFTLNMKMLKKIMLFSIPLGISTACGTFRHEMDKFFIGLVTNTEQLALYTNAAKELPLTMISASFTAILIPHITKLQKDNNNDAAIELWQSAIILSLLINSIFAIGLFVFSKEAVTFLYSEKYIESAPVFAIYSLSYILRCTYFGMILNTRGKTKTILNGSFISLITNAIFNIILYYTIGFIGPAIATLLSTIVGIMYLLFNTSKELDIPFSKIFPWKKSGNIIGINIVIGLLFIIIKTMINLNSMNTRIIFALVSAVCWCAIEFFIYKKTIIRCWKKLKVNN